MTGEPVEHRAERMLAAFQRIAARMYTLDAHAGRRFLKDDRLGGVTAQTARRVGDEADRLWVRFNELRRLSDKIPGQPLDLSRTALTELERLLSDDCVEVDAEGVPAFASGRPVAASMSMADFADGIETDCGELLRECAAVDAACGAVADAAAAVTERLNTAAGLAQALDMTGNATLERLTRRRATALGEALADPLTAAQGGPLTELSAELADFEQRLRELDTAGRELPQRLDELRDRLAALGRAEAGAGELCELTARKILAPPPPRLVPAAQRLTVELAAVAQRAEQDDRHGAAAQFAALATALEQAEQECRRVDDTANSLLDRRAELRGRLAAYTRKAARLGVIEEPRVAASARAATEILALAPCDLRSATRAVRDFQLQISAAQEAPA